MQAGDIIGGRYRLQRHIGEGGQASVWQAMDGTLDREVAVKFLFASDARERDALTAEFLREAKLSASVRHRNVVQVLDFGTHTDNVPFMVIELLEGEELAERLERGVMPIEEALEVGIRALEGLAAVHEAGIVHRDLKPENIFLCRDRTGVYPKLLDFGISKRLDPTGRSQGITQPGEIVGTPEYMSPEQARGLRDVDHRTDIYAMGVVIYEAIAGHAPFEDENMGDLLMKVIKGDAPELCAVVPEVGRPVSDVVMRALSREREDRFADAIEMRDALVTAAEESFEGFDQSSVPAPASGRTSREFPTRRNIPAPASAGLELPEPIGAAMDAASVPTPGQRPGWVMPAAAGAGLLVLGAATLALLRDAPQQPAQTRYIVVKGSEAAATEAAPVDPVPDPTADTQAQAPTEARAPEPASTAEPAAPPRDERRADDDERVRKKPSESPDQVTRLTRAFTRQKASVAHCFEQHASDVGQGAHMSVRIALDAAGSVRSADVSPADLGQSAAGRCIAGAVGRMRFGRQPEAVAFRVPLTARRSQ